MVFSAVVKTMSGVYLSPLYHYRMFYDSNGDQNTGNYTVNVSAAPPAVPEASTNLSLGLMLALGLGGLIVTARKRHVTAK